MANYDPITQTKQCSACGERKPVSAFAVRVARLQRRDPFMAKCKPCERAALQQKRRSYTTVTKQKNAGSTEKYRKSDKGRKTVNAFAKKRRLRPDVKAANAVYRRAYEARPEHKARRKELRGHPDRKAKQRAYDAARQRRAEVRLSNKLRCQRRRGAPGVGITATDVAEIYDAQKKKCGACCKPLRGRYQIDHIIAITRGGRHERSNIQLLCASCNRQKAAKDPIDFMRELGRLL